MWNSQFPYEDQQHVAMAMQDIGNYTPPMTQYGSSSLYLRKFRAGENDRLAFTWQLPHGYKIGSSLKPHLHWLATGGQGGDVGWRMLYQWVPIDGACNSSGSTNPGDVVIAYATLAAELDTHLVTDFADLAPDATPQGISSVLFGLLWRADQGGGNGEFDGEVFLLSFDVHIQRDASGSREATIK